MTPTLRSRRLILHPYTRMLVSQEHVDWLNDAELMQYSEQRYVQHSLKGQLDYVGSAPCHFWLIRCDTCTDIGTITAYVDDDNKRANLGILLGNRAYQGRGLAKEAWLTVMDWLFEEGTHKIEAGCRGDNHRMRRLATTTGMMLEGEIPGHFRVGDKFVSLVLYGRFKADRFVSEWDQMWQEPFYKPKGYDDEGTPA